MFVIDSKKDRLIRQAIHDKRIIRFLYTGKVRVVEPHDYGVQSGKVQLLSYQIGGETTSSKLPAWRRFDVNLMSEISLQNDHFKGSRGADFSQHYDWDELYARVA